MMIFYPNLKHFLNCKNFDFFTFFYRYDYTRWIMDSKNKTSWDKSFENCLHFLCLYNRYPTISEKDKNHVKIAHWIKYQKLKYKNGQLEKEKITMLEKLSDWKWSKEKKICKKIYFKEDEDDPIIDDEPEKRKVHYTEYYDPIEEFDD